MKSKMTEEERSRYLERCKNAIQFLKGACGPLLNDEEETQQLIENGGMFARCEYLLASPAAMVLADLQSPKDVSDYSQEHLQEWRRICQKLGEIRIRVNQFEQNKHRAR